MDDAQREQLTERFRPSARRAVQRLVVLDQLRQAEGLDVTDGEIEAHIAKMAQEQHMEPQELRRAIAGSNNMERLRNDLAEEKVFGMLEQHANITVVERSVDEDVPADGPAAAPKQGGALSGSQQETQAAASAAGQSAEGPPPAAPGRKE
jgi:FKBP-type peptidyl-prolyl cis-trans isomerase (trigger factor)